jgi:hypothetical protein
VKACYTGAASDYSTPNAPKVRIQVFDLAGALADPPDGMFLVGFLTFRNRLTGM